MMMLIPLQSLCLRTLALEGRLRDGCDLHLPKIVAPIIATIANVDIVHSILLRILFAA
jgi:hypothetical protein